MNDEPDIIAEIRRQGLLIRWTLVGCFAVLTFFIGYLHLGLIPLLVLCGRVLIVAGFVLLFWLFIASVFSQQESLDDQSQVEPDPPGEKKVQKEQ